ncbi:hypothetical protein T484DRAFT_1849968 [Baffinella frigidus]|nr:hypothetical protein T484DRAFT_1849968 [Cryptophyta sp. CCMP2293]
MGLRSGAAKGHLGDSPRANPPEADGVYGGRTASGGGAAAWGSEVEQQKARERLASFLGTLFVKQAIVGADEVVLAHVASCNPGLAGTGLVPSPPTCAGRVLDAVSSPRMRVRGGCSSAQLLAVAVPGKGAGRVLDAVSSPRMRVRGGCSSAQLLAVAVPGKASPGFTALLGTLLDGLTLSREEAQELGGFFFDDPKLLDGKTLSREEAEELGGFFFDAGEPVEGKVLGAHLLRVSLTVNPEAEELGGFFFDAGEPVEGKVLGAHLLRVRLGSWGGGMFDAWESVEGKVLGAHLLRVRRLRTVMPGGAPGPPGHSSTQGEGLGAFEGGIDGPDPPLGEGAPERERQRGHRAWLPGSWRPIGSPGRPTRRTAAFRRRR